MHINEETLKNITIRKTKRNFRLSLNTQTDEKFQASPPKLRKLRNRNKKKMQPVSEENVVLGSNVEDNNQLHMKSNTYTQTLSKNENHSKKHPYNVSDEPSPTPSHETIDFLSSPDKPNRRSTSDSGETFFEPMETIEKERTKSKVETDQTNEIPDQDNTRTCNITFRTKRKPIPGDDNPNLLPPLPMQNSMYAKSMADIFTDSTLAEQSRKSDDSRSKLREFIDSMVAKNHDTSISKLITEPANEKDSGCEDPSSDWGKKTRNKEKTAGVSKRTCDKRNQLENLSEVQCLGSPTIEDDVPSEWSRIGIRKRKPVPATPSKTPLISTTLIKSLTKTPPKNTSKTPLKLLSKTPHKTPSKTTHKTNKNQTNAGNTQTVSESPSHTNPVVLLDRITASSINSLHKNRSIQTQSSESTFETKPVKLVKPSKHIKATNQTKSPSSFYKTSKAQKDESVYCKSCQKKTPRHEKNFGSYEIGDDDDEDFVSNEVSNLSGVGQLEARNENHGQDKKTNGGVGKLMKDVVAFVDVKLDGSDKSRGVIQILNQLGAQISKSFHKNVSHVIFYEGALATVEKAMQWSIPIVSVKWVNSCKQTRLLLCTEAFPPVHIEHYMDSIRQNKDELFKTVLRTVAKDLDEIVASGAGLHEIEVPLSILVLRKYVTPYEADSEHIYNLASIELSLGLDRPRRVLLRGLVFPHLPSSDSSESDWTLSPVVLPPRCSAPARICSKAHPVSKEMQYGDEVEKIRSILGTQKKDTEKKSGGGGGGGSRTEVKRDRRSNEEVATQNRQDFHDALNRLRGPVKTPNKKTAPHNIEPRTSKPKAATPHLLAAKKKIHFLRSSLSNRAKDTPSPLHRAMPRDVGKPGARVMPQTPPSSPSEEMCVKAVQSVDWRNGSDLKSSSEMPVAPGKRIIRKRCLYEDASFEEPLQSVKKKMPKRKPKSDPHKGKVLPFDKLMRDQKYSNIYDTDQSEKEENDSSRSSSYWFVSQSESTTHKSRTRNPNRDKPGIVCTGINSKDIKSLYSTITELGHFILEPRVSARTTHVVVEGPKRTLNLLKGIARGCWIVKRDWVHASRHTGRWLYEQRFELSSFSPAVQRCRMERQTFGALYAFDILSKLGPIFVSRTSQPPRPDLQELIALCGGRVAPTMREADIVLGGTRAAGREHVNETWLMDCLTKCSLLAFEKYRIS